jgi:uncharacterized membrane protein
MNIPTNRIQNIARVCLGSSIVFAGLMHMTFLRTEFQAQVPDWVPLSKDLIVLFSGVVELVLGLALLFVKHYRIWIGVALAIFFVLIFPGNIAQYINRVDAFAMYSDERRLIRLFFQPVLIFVALWSTGFFTWYRMRNKNK